MKIGFFTSIEGWGGSESYLLSLMTGVRDRGHDVVLFGVRDTRLFKECAALALRAVAWTTVGVDVLAADTPRRGRGVRAFRGLVPAWARLLLGCRRQARAVGALLRKHPVDVLQVNVNGYEVAGWAAQREGIPTLGMYMTSPGPEAWWVRRWLIRRSIRTYTRVSAQSVACMEEWIRLTGLARGSCTPIPNGVEVGRFAGMARDCAKRPDGMIRLVSVGRLHPMKGFPDVIAAMEKVHDLSLQLDILGEGPQERELRQQVLALGLSDRVHFVGHAENPEHYLAAADVFVLASVSHESGPAALAEAMAAGLPVVTSDFGPLAEMNVHGRTGLVAPAKNPAKLAEAFRTLATDAALRARMGVEGRARAGARFSRGAMIEATLAEYRRARGEHGDEPVGL